MKNHIAMATTIAGLGLTLALVLLLGGESLPIARAESFTVDVLNDESDGSCAPGDCSLREAIIEANGNGQADEITLGPGTHALTITGTNENDCATGDLDVSEALTITGQGPDQTIIDASGVFTDRVFDIRHGADTVVISGVTIINGTIAGSGGGIYNYSADLTLSNVDIVSNTADFPGLGGGIYNHNANLYLYDVDIIGNVVTGTVYYGWGGGIYARNGSALLERVRLVNNNAQNNGGGAYLHYGSATLLDTQVLSNSAETGAGLYVAIGEATVSGGEIRSNVASASGGGVYIYDAVFTQTGLTEIAHNVAGEGGGLYVRHDAEASLTGARIYSNTLVAPGAWVGYGGGLCVGDATATVSGGHLTGNTGEVGGGAANWGTLTLVNTTVSGNSADDDSGGIWNEGTLVMTYTTVADNTSVGGSGGIGNQQDAFALNTIVAHNDPYNCVDDPLTSNGYNLEDVDDCGLAGPGDLIDTDPKLDPLAEERGTVVHGLRDDSPAIDAGLCLVGITTDQRDVDRPQGAAGKCDIGAYEFDTVYIYLPMVVRAY
jgi:CSLREA domain-containing protein